MLSALASSVCQNNDARHGKPSHAVHSLTSFIGPCWSLMSMDLPGRSSDGINARYRKSLNPTINKGRWCVEEDAQLISTCNRDGTAVAV